MLVQWYLPKAGISTTSAAMLTYSAIILIGWTALPVSWLRFGWPLGPVSQLFYPH